MGFTYLFPRDGIQRQGKSTNPKKSQGSSPSEWTGWISLEAKGLSRVFSNTTVQKHQFFSAQLSFTVQLSHPYMTIGKTIALTYGKFILLRSENNKTLLSNYSPITFFKESFFGRANAFYFYEIKILSFPFNVYDFCVLFKKILPTSLLPRFCSMFYSKQSYSYSSYTFDPF